MRKPRYGGASLNLDTSAEIFARTRGDKDGDKRWGSRLLDTLWCKDWVRTLAARTSQLSGGREAAP
jgi:hypothetical protein